MDEVMNDFVTKVGCHKPWPLQSDYNADLTSVGLEIWPK